MRICYGGKRIEFWTGYKIDLDQWDANKQRVKKNVTNSQRQKFTKINADLVSYECAVSEIFRVFEYSRHKPTVEEVKFKLIATTRGADYAYRLYEKTFFEYFDEFVNTEGIKGAWTKAMYEKYSSLRKKLRDFKYDITLDDFNEECIAKFAGYLLEVKKMRNTTILKNVQFLKTFLRWCYRKGYTHDIDFSNYKFKMKTIQRKVIFLTPDELKQLKDFPIPSSKYGLSQVRDVFVFMCYTGLRYSDTYNLHKSDIVGDHIEITTIKTHDSLRIELNNCSKAILDKYKNVSNPENKALPVIANQKMNEALKELAYLVGIKEPVSMVYYVGRKRVEEVLPKYCLMSTHVARRTFICNALAMGIPANVVMKWTGHSDYKAMKPYIDITDLARVVSMEKFNDIEGNIRNTNKR
jgi:integrase